jgi:hypothetical protein
MDMNAMSLDMDSYMDDILQDFNIDLGDFEGIPISSDSNRSSSNERNGTGEDINKFINNIIAGEIFSI